MCAQQEVPTLVQNVMKKLVKKETVQLEKEVKELKAYVQVNTQSSQLKTKKVVECYKEIIKKLSLNYMEIQEENVKLKEQLEMRKED